MSKIFKLKSRHKRYLAIGLFLMVFCLFIWLLIFIISSSHKTFPFASLLPKDTPFAIEGTPQEIKLFLRKRCGISPNFIESIDMEKDPQARILVATLNYSEKESPACQAHLLEIANSVEELWNKTKSYPQSLGSVTPCPLEGQIAYQTDKESFTLVCKGKEHKSLYNSRSGLQRSTPRLSTTSLKDRSSKDQSVIEKERLAELKNRSRTVKMIKNSSIDNLVEENTNLLQSTINADSNLAQKIDANNLPLPSSDLPQRFNLADPFIIVVANVKENLANFFTLEAHPQLQIWSPTPGLAKNILTRETHDFVNFQPLQDTDLQIIADFSLAQEAFPSTKFLNLPKNTVLTLTKDQRHYEGELTLPSSSDALYEKLVNSASNAQGLLDRAYPGPAAFAFTEAFQDLCTYPINEKMPMLWGISFDSSKSLYLDHVRFQFNEVLAGRAPVDMFAQFTDEKEAEEWLKNSPWYNPEENPYSHVRGEGKAILINAGQLPQLPERVKATDKHQPCLACGYFTLREDSIEKIYRFAIGVPKNEEAREAKVLWLTADVPE